jgi:membrane protein YdbS with pleckstrin-like domain
MQKWEMDQALKRHRYKLEHGESAVMPEDATAWLIGGCCVLALIWAVPVAIGHYLWTKYGAEGGEPDWAISAGLGILVSLAIWALVFAFG